MGVSALYPHAQPQQNALSGNVLSLLPTIMQLQQFRSQQAAGQAFQGAVGPDGSFNPNSAMSAIASNPAAALAAPEATTRLLAARGQNIANETSSLALGLQNSSTLAQIAAPYANKPMTDMDVASLKAKLAAAGVNPQTVAAADINGALKASKAAQLGAAQTMGPAAAASPVPVAPTASGAPAVAPLASTLGGGAPRPVGLPPGQAEAASGIAAASAAQANSLTQAADTSPIRKGMLGNLEGDLAQFTAGPGADWTKVAKAWANRNVLPSGMQFDPTSIASQEAFTKQAEQLAQQQFAAIGGTGTDAKFGSAFKSNPNETLSALGNNGIINLLKGNEDAIQAKNGAWQKWVAAGNPPQSYPQFAAQFNQSFDPRVYQSQYMSKNDFVKMAKGMSTPELRDFSAKLNSAKGQGLVTGPGAYYGGQ
jgi:hypothetical protein